EPYFINLYDINGKLIKRVIGNCENVYEKIIINTDDLAPAIYLIDVNTETNKEIKKLIITK
ncbi:MAG TPA: T9SS type A sorting domain-containing protein, partial [Bacteroidales bacterium]|nr:T9SS type A sorting domain-containing protein [Bacteroidales bacterium]